LFFKYSNSAFTIISPYTKQTKIARGGFEKIHRVFLKTGAKNRPFFALNATLVCSYVYFNIKFPKSQYVQKKFFADFSKNLTNKRK